MALLLIIVADYLARNRYALSCGRGLRMTKAYAFGQQWLAHEALRRIANPVPWWS